MTFLPDSKESASDYCSPNFDTEFNSKFRNSAVHLVVPEENSRNVNQRSALEKKYQYGVGGIKEISKVRKNKEDGNDSMMTINDCILCGRPIQPVLRTFDCDGSGSCGLTCETMEDLEGVIRKSIYESNQQQLVSFGIRSERRYLRSFHGDEIHSQWNRSIKV